MVVACSSNSAKSHFATGVPPLLLLKAWGFQGNVLMFFFPIIVARNEGAAVLWQSFESHREKYFMDLSYNFLLIWAFSELAIFLKASVVNAIHMYLIFKKKMKTISYLGCLLALVVSTVFLAVKRMAMTFCVECSVLMPSSLQIVQLALRYPSPEERQHKETDLTPWSCKSPKKWSRQGSWMLVHSLRPSSKIEGGCPQLSQSLLPLKKSLIQYDRQQQRRNNSCDGG